MKTRNRIAPSAALAAALALLLAAQAHAQSPGAPAHKAQAAQPRPADAGAPAASGLVEKTPAPWSVRPLPAKAVPAVYLSEWKKAANRKTCAPLALQGVEKQLGAKVRRADFSGGWAVAYDLPGRRSAYGIAGSGSSARDGGTRYTFPRTITWADGSYANYGLKGGTGPGYLAYMVVEGQDCLYNVWADHEEELELLLTTLRRIKTPGK